VLRQTAAVLVAFPTFFTSQIATTSLAVALGQTGALACAPVPRLGVGLVLLKHRRQRGPVGDCLCLRGGSTVAAGAELRAIARHARRHCRVHGHAGSPELRGWLRRAAQPVVGTGTLEWRPCHALGRGRNGRHVAGGCLAHALPAGDAMRRIEVARGQRVRVRAVLGERAGHGAGRVPLLAGGSDVDRFLVRGLSAHFDTQWLGKGVCTLRTVMLQ
jgi:hypothetical protein